MVMFQCTVENRHLGPSRAKITVTHLGPRKKNPKQLEYIGQSEHQIQFSLRPDIYSLKKVRLDLHGSETDAYDMGSEISAWFSKYLGFETKLVYIGDGSRIVLGSGAPDSDMAIVKRAPVTASLHKFLSKLFKTLTETIAFQHIGQYLVVTKESNDEVSSRLLGIEMKIHKFRPNMISSGSPTAYDEDYWAQLLFNAGRKPFRMDFGGTCWRCQAIVADLKTGQKAQGEEGLVWKMLAKDRMVNKGWKYCPVFGKYGFTSLKDVGRIIRVREEAVLAKRVRVRPIFDWPFPKAVVAAFSG